MEHELHGRRKRHMTGAEKSKRHEIAEAIHRDDPDMPDAYRHGCGDGEGPETVRNGAGFALKTVRPPVSLDPSLSVERVWGGWSLRRQKTKGPEPLLIPTPALPEPA